MDLSSAAHYAIKDWLDTYNKEDDFPKQEFPELWEAIHAILSHITLGEIFLVSTVNEEEYREMSEYYEKKIGTPPAGPDEIVEAALNIAYER